MTATMIVVGTLLIINSGGGIRFRTLWLASRIADCIVRFAVDPEANYPSFNLVNWL